MKLQEARVEFTRNIAKVIERGFDQGYLVALGKDGMKHMPNSLHWMGLAVDLVLYDREGNYLQDTVDYYDLGQFWKSLNSYCRWGGDFQKKDGNHFSFAPPELVGNRG